MPAIELIFALDTEASREPDRWTRPIIDAWPREGDEVTHRVEPWRGLDDTLAASGSSAGRTGPVRVVVAVLDAGSGLTPAYQLVDTLQRGMIPGVMLVAETGAGERKLESAGVVVERHGIEPARLATIARTLAARQAAVRALAGEERIARSSQGGMRGEMERLHDEMHLAATVQRAMLPARLPTADTLAFGAMYRPTGYVSGDIYDVRRLDEHRLAFLLADAVGHGVPAALLTMVIARALKLTDDRGRPLEPSETLALLNDELCLFSGGGQRFATAAYGVVDTRTHEITLSTAGHPPPLLVGGGGAPIPIETGGPLLGVFEGAPYEQTSLTLDAGRSLVFYSDGFEVAFPDAEASEHDRRLPTTRYVDVFAEAGERVASGAADVDAAIEVIARDLDFQPGSLHQADDVTAVMITATGAPVAQPECAEAA
ncbi:MAG: PP2C family protein-serine/threonine phosphatase [Planctomycetota bacterium]